MTQPLSRLQRDERGAGAIEFALVAPALFALIIGIAQLGILFAANAGLKHAVGEAARYATVYPRPSESQILAMFNQKRFGLDPKLITANIAPAQKLNNRDYIDMTISYPVPMKIPFVSATAVTLVETRRVFVYPK